MKQKNTTIKFKKSVNKTDDKENENPQKEKIYFSNLTDEQINKLTTIQLYNLIICEGIKRSKEYEKLQKKYENHPNKEFIIKQKMYQKGYNLDI